MEDSTRKKLIAILSVIAVLLIAFIVLYYVFDGKKEEPPKVVDEKITITFDTNGGNEIDSVKINKGSTVDLPTPTKEDYDFQAWYEGDVEVTNETTFSKDTTLVAQWMEAKEGVNYYTITFDSKGGSEVESVRLECDKELTLPETKPTKEGYNFVSWADINGKVILDGALLACEDLTLYANWEKIEAKYYTITFDSKGGSKVEKMKVECDKELTLPDNPTKEGYAFVAWHDKNETPILNKALLSCEDITLYADWKKYTCPDGSNLNSDKCIYTEDAKTKCSGNYVYEYEGNCVKVSTNSRKNPDKVCGEKMINTGGGHTSSVKGELFVIGGASYCFYKEVSDTYEQQSSSNCTSRTHKWNSSNNKCYYDKDDPNVNITYNCIDTTYAYIDNPKKLTGLNDNRDGCFQIVDRTKYCDSGWKLENDKCTKTIDATLE